MAALVELLGETLSSKSGPVSTSEALAGKGAVALYFSAHWCPPCRRFTPELGQWYTEGLQAKGLEVIFVSSDRDEAAFAEYYGGMPWLALPFADRERKEALSSKFKVRGIPTLVLLDGEGKLITADGRAAVSADPSGEDFPWRPKSLSELLAGAKLLRKDGSTAGTEALEGKVLGLYFSAHWCPPCRGFTPQLAKWYSEGLQAKGLEVVFVSSDRDEEAFKSYYSEMPWLALDFADRKRKEQLSSRLGVDGIPSFIIVGADGAVITKEGRAAVSADPEGKDFPWAPKPVRDLAAGPGLLEEVPTVIAFAEAAGKAAQQAAEEALRPAAERYLAEMKAAGAEEPKYAFMVATSAAGVAARLRQLMDLPKLPPGEHEHPLAVVDSGAGWGCDGCGGGDETSARHRCTQGCDFDLCGDCFAQAGKGPEVPARLALLDIPSQGAFYEVPGDVTAEAVAQLLADFEAGKLERKQLG